MKRELGSWELPICWTGDVDGGVVHQFRVYLMSAKGYPSDADIEITAALSPQMLNEIMEMAVEEFEAEGAAYWSEPSSDDK